MSKTRAKAARTPKDGGAGGGKGKSKAREQSAIRGMLLGAAIIAALVGFFMVPVKGKTTFTHLIHALGLQGGDADETAKDAGKDGKVAGEKGKNAQGRAPRPAPARETTAAGEKARTAPTGVRGLPAGSTTVAAARTVAPVRPQGIKVASDLKGRAPLERASAADDAALDRLVRRHAQD
jgi:hypothetical protein